MDYSFHQNNSIYQHNTQIIWPSASTIVDTVKMEADE